MVYVKGMWVDLKIAVVELLYFIIYSCGWSRGKKFNDFGFSDNDTIVDLAYYFSPTNIINLHNFFLKN